MLSSLQYSVISIRSSICSIWFFATGWSLDVMRRMVWRCVYYGFHCSKCISMCRIRKDFSSTGVWKICFLGGQTIKEQSLISQHVSFVTSFSLLFPASHDRAYMSRLPMYRQAVFYVQSAKMEPCFIKLYRIIWYLSWQTYAIMAYL